MNSHLYIEGGGDSKRLHIECRAGFRKLIESCGFVKCFPRLTACGSRKNTFDDFLNAHSKSFSGAYIAMLIDSEEPMTDFEKTWEHLKRWDNWERPADASDEQVLLMVTCMETWIAADYDILRTYFGRDFQESALPALTDIETRNRQLIQKALSTATRKCKKNYEKGKISFELIGRLTPSKLEKHLQSFVRFVHILSVHLK